MLLKVHSAQVDLQKLFPICQMSSVYQAASKNRDHSFHEDLEYSQADWERGITPELLAVFRITELSGIVQGIHLVLQFLNSKQETDSLQIYSLSPE